LQGQIKKDAVIIHESDVKALEKYPEKERGKLARLIACRGIQGEIGELPEETRLALQPIFDGIDTERRRYKNVQYLQKLIDGIKQKAVSIPTTKENHDHEIINNLIKVLQRMIADCRQHYRLTEHIQTEVRN